MTKSDDHKPIHAVFVEDSHGFSEALTEFISFRPCGVKCVAVYPTAEEALKKLEGVPFDVAVVDIHLPGMSGIEFVVRLREIRPSVICMMLTMYEDSQTIFDALKAGASGYLLKRASAREIVAAVKEVAGGGSPMSPQIARCVVDFFHESPRSRQPLETLTERERTVLELLAQGALYKEISDTLQITMSTVRYHVRQIYDKLHVHSRTEATLKYLGKEPKGPPKIGVGK